MSTDSSFSGNKIHLDLVFYVLNLRACLVIVFENYLLFRKIRRTGITPLVPMGMFGSCFTELFSSLKR